MSEQLHHVRDGSSSALGPPTDYVRVDVRQAGADLLLEVSGEADLYTGEVLLERLRGALAPVPLSVTVDVSRLRFCDLTGLDALDEFCAEAATLGAPAALRGMSPLLAWLRDTFSPLDGPPA